MEFSKLNFEESPKCDCLNGAAEDTSRVFIRRTGEKKKLRNGDFKVDIHKEEKVLTITNCKEFCGARELSIDCLDGYDEKSIAAKYLEMVAPFLKISPGRNYYYVKFKFKTDSGVVKHTPIEGQESHHDFYKSDGFTVDIIEQLELPIPVNIPVSDTADKQS